MFGRETTRTTSFGVTPSGLRDLSAQEWSQAVINELESVQVATPPIKDCDPVARFDADRNTTTIPTQNSKLPFQQTQNMDGTSNPNQRNTSSLPAPQRPQAGKMDSAATIDLVKQIPGGW